MSKTTTTVNGKKKSKALKRPKGKTKAAQKLSRANNISELDNVFPQNSGPSPVRVYPDYPRTDAGNAELFAYVFRDGLRYDHKRGRWLKWQKNWWAEDERAVVQQAAKAVARLRGQFALTLDDAKVYKKEFDWALRSEARPRLEAMLKLAESEPLLADDGTGWDANPWLLGVKNGVIDLRTGKLHDGKQADKITMHTDVEFDPAARASRWEQFISEIFGRDQQMMEYVQRAVGYSLTGDVSEQVIFLAHGTGANGKSTFLEVLRHVLGAYAYNLPFSAFELKSRSAIPNEIAALSGKRYVTAIETNESVELNEGRIKALTGSDPISARFLYGEFFTFLPTGKYWLAFNHKPNVSDNSPGFWRRVRLIPFEQQFTADNVDPDLLDKLKAEAAGILNWAIAGALKWQKDGLRTPEVVMQASKEYRDESDVLKDFVEERCENVPDAIETAADVWNEYLAHAAANHDRPLTRKAFAQKMQMRGYKKIRVGHERTWVWVGVKLRRNIPAHDPLVDPGGLRADADVRFGIVTEKPCLVC